MRPTFRNLTESYESWAYRNGLLFQLHRLERRRWIERKASAPEDRIYRLTEEGRCMCWADAIPNDAGHDLGTDNGEWFFLTCL